MHYCTATVACDTGLPAQCNGRNGHYSLALDMWNLGAQYPLVNCILTKQHILVNQQNTLPCVNTIEAHTEHRWLLACGTP